MLVFTGAASATAYGDAVGDANTPADISLVTASESGATVAVSVEVANFRSLPQGSSLTLWFDADANPGTGNSDGQEARVRYDASGTVGLQLWSGTRLADRSAAGISAAFEDGRLSFRASGSTLGIDGPFGLLVVSARGQPAGNGEFVASDSAPEGGMLSYAGSGVVTLADRVGDHESAPDLGSIDVTDAQDGWVTFAITIQNAGALPRQSLVGISIDADDEARTGESGADLGITALGTEIVADRWSERARNWIPDDGARVRVEASGAVVTIGVHRSELGASGRIGFAVLAAGVTGTTFTGIDVAPDGAAFYRYALQYRADVRLVAGKLTTAPARPRPGRALVVSAPVSRSDTKLPARTGYVTCRVTVDGKRVSAVGRYERGRASCSFSVRRGARRVAGTMTVRADGIASTIPFALSVR
jgi:hypothetical protein